MSEFDKFPARIVLVEDDFALARTTSRVLRDLGEVVVETYYDVASAKEALARDFDVLVSDFNLPDGTGLEVLTAAASTVEHAPRILVTANTEWDCAARSLNEGGAFRILGKPLADDVLMTAVEQALRIKRAADARARDAATNVRHQHEIAIANADLFVEKLSMTRETVEERRRIVRALARAVDRRFGKDFPRTTTMAAMARAFAAHLGVEGEDLQVIESGILLHRLGSIALRDSEDPALIPELGVDVLREIGLAANVQQVVADQGERFDGKGLFRRHGVGIALGARILAIVDRYLRRTEGVGDHDLHERACIELLEAEDLDPELVASFVVERMGSWEALRSDTLPYIPSMQQT